MTAGVLAATLPVVQLEPARINALARLHEDTTTLVKGTATTLLTTSFITLLTGLLLELRVGSVTVGWMPDYLSPTQARRPQGKHEDQAHSSSFRMLPDIRGRSDPDTVGLAHSVRGGTRYSRIYSPYARLRRAAGTSDGFGTNAEGPTGTIRRAWRGPGMTSVGGLVRSPVSLNPTALFVPTASAAPNCVPAASFQCFAKCRSGRCQAESDEAGKHRAVLFGRNRGDAGQKRNVRE